MFSTAIDGARRVRALFAARAALLGTVLAIAALCFAFVKAARGHTENFNTNPRSSDQSAYLVLGEHARMHSGVFMDGARGPLYSLSLLTVYREGMDRETFFQRAQWFTIFLTAAGWLGLWFLLRRHLPSGQALAAWGSIGLVSLVYYAPYVKAEAPFFAAQLAAFLLFARLLLEPGWKLAAITGFVFAIAWLLKSSVSILFAAFLGAAALDLAVRLARAQGSPRERIRGLLPRLAAPALVALVFLVVCSPFLIENRRKFGHAFYNVNSTFYMWYDSWAEAKRGTRAHGDRLGFPDMPESELPSAKKYFATHSREQIVRRVERGIDDSLEGMTKLGMTRYGLEYLAALVVALVLHARRSRELAVKYWPLLAFTGAFFAAHVVLSAWFYPMALGPRVMASAFPIWIAACAITLLHQCRPDDDAAARRLNLAAALAFAVGLMLVYDVPASIDDHLAVANGGR